MVKRTPTGYLWTVIVYAVYGIITALFFVTGNDISSIPIEIIWMFYNLWMLLSFASRSHNYEQAAAILPGFFIILFVFGAFIKSTDINMAIINTIILSFLEIIFAVYLMIGKRKLTGKQPITEPDPRYLNPKRHSFGLNH